MKITGHLRKIEPVWRSRLILALKIAIAAGLIIFLFSSGRLDFTLIINSYKNSFYLVSGVLCCSMALVTPIFRWWILVRVQKLPLGGFDAFRLTMIGYFFNLVIPGGTGGDVVRAVYTVRDCMERRAQALTIVFVDRGLGLHALLLLGFSIIFIQPTLFYNHPELKPWVLLLGGLLLVGTLVPLLLLWNRTNGFMMRLFGRMIGGEAAWHDAMGLYKKQPLMVFIAYVFSLGSAVFNVLAIHFMMLAVGSNPTISESVAIAPLVILANTLPFTPGGIGVAEGAGAALYALVGQAAGANGMLLTRFFIVMHGLMGLPFFMINKRKTNQTYLSKIQRAGPD